MSRNSLILMDDSNDNISLIGEPIRADGWFGYGDGSHTVSIQVHRFTGRVLIEASLATEPTDKDWFPVWLSTATPFLPMEVETSTIAHTFEGNFVWLRARLDRDYIQPQPDTIEEIAQLGSVKKIMLNH